ncbi:hypothetical protein ACFQYP_62600 [Nonomuraea antimicrobica]
MAAAGRADPEVRWARKASTEVTISRAREADLEEVPEGRLDPATARSR